MNHHFSCWFLSYVPKQGRLDPHPDYLLNYISRPLHSSCLHTSPFFLPLERYFHEQDSTYYVPRMTSTTRTVHETCAAGRKAVLDSLLETTLLKFAHSKFMRWGRLCIAVTPIGREKRVLQDSLLAARKRQDAGAAVKLLTPRGLQTTKAPWSTVPNGKYLHGNPPN